MKTITFSCETITPMFLSGADGQTPELRPPSIKGAMRFWWRAMNGDLVRYDNEKKIFDYSKLAQTESAIFGGTEPAQRSKVIILYPTITKQTGIEISSTPHHKEKGCKIKGCDSNHCAKGKKRKAVYYNFDLTIKYNPIFITENEIISCIKNAFLFGGLGKRSRRGFGSVMITKINGEHLATDLNYLKNTKKVSVKSNFGYFEKSEIGKKFESGLEVLEAIGLASHDNSSDWLGLAKGQNRFASPIYVSVIKVKNSDNKDEYYPIITTLNTAPKNDLREPNTQTSFIKALK